MTEACEQFEQWFNIVVNKLGRTNLEELCGTDEPWQEEWGQGGLLDLFPPSGEGLEELCAGHPHGDEVLRRLQEFFALAAKADSSGGSTFTVPPIQTELADEEVRQLLLEYASNMRAMSELCGCEDGVKGAGNPPKLIHSDDLDNSFGLTISFFSEQHEDKFGNLEHPLFHLTEPLYQSCGCSYIVPCYVLWPLSKGESTLEDPFRPAFELWKHGVNWAYPEDAVIHYCQESD